MELERLCKRVSNISNSIERAYIKDLSNILDDIFFEYDIFYKNTDQIVQKDILLRRFLSVFGKQQLETSKVCIGVSQNGNKCCKRAQEGSDYCKTHKYLEFKKQISEDKTENLFVIEDSVIPKHLDVSQLKTQLIDDTFYYVDSSFIYDKSSLERVGYVEGNKYILTDDPFVLCL